MENRRRAERHRVRRTGLITVEHRSFAAETVNLSLTGVRITTDSPLLEGADIDIKLHLQESPFFGCFSAKGVVIWCHEGIDVGFEAGIELSLPADDRTLMSTFLNNLEKSS